MCKVGKIKTHIGMVMSSYPSVHLFILKFQVDSCLADFDYTGYEICAIAGHPSFVVKFCTVYPKKKESGSTKVKGRAGVAEYFNGTVITGSTVVTMVTMLTKSSEGGYMVLAKTVLSDISSERPQ